MQTLYRKYRPKNFSEVIGQTHIVRTLTNAIKNGRVGQAYLFTGPRGTGKTSIARILAKTVNCEKIKDSITCEKCPSCELINSNQTLDIIEIDAASNTGVDNIRELRETIALRPTTLKYKIYIIDEVHMLSTGAFNALLKTLEEPPSHVIFILATTEIHKVPETIISRCQRFDFARLPLENIVEKLSLIAASEKVKIEKEALEMIAISAEGGMRDAESLMAQIISLEDKNITSKEVEEILGTTDRKFALELADLIFQKKSQEALSKINTLSEDGYDLEIFAKTFLNFLRQLMLLRIDPILKKHFVWEMPQEELKKILGLTEQAELSEIISTINLFLEAKEKIPRSIIPQLPLEIAIIKSTRTFPAPTDGKPGVITYRMENPPASSKEKISASPTPETGAHTPVASDLPAHSNPAGSGLKPEPHDSDKTHANVSIPEEATNNYVTRNLTLQEIRENWNKLLIDIKPFNHSLSVLLSTCQATGASGNVVSVSTPYEFYEQRLSDAKNKLTIEEVFSKILESKVTFKISVDKNLIPQKIEESDQPAENASHNQVGKQDSLLTDALEIIGGKVVSE
jgi:DNA polymerase III subunit gamma/tau